MDSCDDFDKITPEEINDITKIIAYQDLPTAINTIKDFLKKQDLVELNVGVTGESGSGKSTFVNAFRGLGDEDEGSAKTGVVETTFSPEVYTHPKYPNVKFWDLPGIGTPNFKADEYLRKVEFERYDFFIIIASDRFRECHSLLAKEIKRMGKTFYFVRSKIDIDIANESRKKNFDLRRTLDIIRENCKTCLTETEIEDPVVFLISGKELGKFDLDLLHERMERELPQHKRRVLMLALPNITLEINERKKRILEKNIPKIALVSAGVATVPIPGLSAAVDVMLIMHEIDTYFKAFGLDDESLLKLSEKSGKSIEELKSQIKFPLMIKMGVSTILSLLGAAAVVVTESAVESVLSFIPIIGTVVAGGLSFMTVSIMLKKALSAIAKDARNVLLAALKTDL